MTIRDKTAATIGLGGINVPSDRMRKLRPEKVAELVESIGNQGLMQPIVVRPRGDIGYWLIAGRHRFEAVKRLKWEGIRATIVEGIKAEQAELLEIDENLIRADLTPAEEAAHHARRKEIYLKLKPETKRGVAGGKAGGRGRKNSKAQNEPSYSKKAASETGKSNASVKRAVHRGEKIADVAELAGTSLDEGEELDALAKLPVPVQRDLIERAVADEKVTAKLVVQQLRREQREIELGDATRRASEALGVKLYVVLYVDAPWKFDTYDSADGMARNPAIHYPCMTVEQITALRVPAAENAVLFLWTTVPHLANAIDVLRAWGFTYRSHVAWKKDKIGLGRWFRNVHELLLVGTRGDVPTPAFGEQMPSVIEAPRGRHSEKPAIFAEMIEQMFPSVPRLEMFARTARPGWDVWGNEVSDEE